MNDPHPCAGQSRGRAWWQPALLAVVVSVPLLPALLGNSSILAFDNRGFPPLVSLRPSMPMAAGEREPPEPARPHGVDMNAFVAPEALRVVPRLRAGELPLWNERQLLGVPEAAGPWAAPDHWLGLAVGPLRGLAWSAALHLAALAVGAWLWLLRRGHGQLGAWAGALVVTTASWPAMHVHRLHFLQAFAWAPWLALAVQRVIRAPDGRGVAWFGVAVAGALLAGAPPIAGLVLLGVLLHAAPDALRDARRTRVLLACTSALLLGAALAAPVLLPARTALLESVRGQGGGPGVTPPAANRLPAAALASFVFPSLSDTPRSAPPRATGDVPDPAEDNPLDVALHLGLLPLALLLLALLRGARPRRDLGLLALALAAALGVPPLDTLLLALPGTPRPDRAVLLVPLAAAGLVARGADLATSTNVRALALVAAVFAALGAIAALLPMPVDDLGSATPSAWTVAWAAPMLVGLLLLGVAAWRRSGRPAAAHRLLAVALALGAVLRLMHAVPPVPITDQYATTPSQEALASLGPGRLVSFDEEVLPAALLQLHGSSSLGGYHPLVPERTAELVAAIDPAAVRVGARAIGPLVDPQALRSPLLDLLGVRFVATGVTGVARLDRAGLPRDGTLREVGRFPDELVALYERPGALPPAWLVSRVERVDADSERLARLGHPHFDARAAALIESPLAPAVEALLSRAGELPRETLTVRRPSPERIELARAGDGEAFAVVSEAWDRGWTARADGRPVTLVRADHGLIGVAWPAGAQALALSYGPPPDRDLGLALAAAAAVLLLVLAKQRAAPIAEHDAP